MRVIKRKEEAVYGAYKVIKSFWVEGYGELKVGTILDGPIDPCWRHLLVVKILEPTAYDVAKNTVSKINSKSEVSTKEYIKSVYTDNHAILNAVEITHREMEITEIPIKSESACSCGSNGSSCSANSKGSDNLKGSEISGELSHQNSVQVDNIIIDTNHHNIEIDIQDTNKTTDTTDNTDNTDNYEVKPLEQEKSLETQNIEPTTKEEALAQGREIADENDILSLGF